MEVHRCVLLVCWDCAIGALGIMVRCERRKDYRKPCIHKEKTINSLLSVKAYSKNEIIEVRTQHRNRKHICFTMNAESIFSLHATFTRWRNKLCAFWFTWFECSYCCSWHQFAFLLGNILVFVMILHSGRM